MLLKFEYDCVSDRIVEEYDGDKKVTKPKKMLPCNGFTLLGKDEVASSNLASSSKDTPK